MKKRILSIVLSIVMLVGLLPTTALAQETHTDHPVCGAAHSDIGDHTEECEEIEWQPLSSLLGEPDVDGKYPGATINTSGNYYLDTNITFQGSDALIINADVSLCLNGHTLTYKARDEAIAVNNDATLNICDCSNGESGVITTYEYEANTIDFEYGTVNLYGGTIVSEGAYAIYIFRTDGESDFNQYGGTVQANGTDSAVEVYCPNVAGTYNLYGGTVKTTSRNSYAVISTSGERATLSMSGAPTISKNSAAFCDIYIETPIHIMDELTADAPEYSVLYSPGGGDIYTGIFTEGWPTYMANKDHEDYFVSAYPDFSVFKDTSGELKIGVPPHEHPVCGADCTHDGDHSTPESWTKLTASNLSNGTLSLTDGKSYYLGENITVSSFVEISGEVNLCLNGHVLSLDESAEDCVIVVGAGSTLNLCDCNGTSQSHKFAVNSDTGLWTLDEINGSETVTGGIITGGKHSGIYVGGNTAALNQYGGHIVGNQNEMDGGGVYLDGSDTYTNKYRMFGGSVVGNTTSESGGGIYIYRYAEFELHGGTVASNHATEEGGGIYTEQGGGDYTKFTMTGGTVSDNTAVDGGGIYSSCDITMSGGSITRNSASATSGGVYARGTMAMSGGSITGNTAGTSGGGLWLYDSTDRYLIPSGKVVINNNTLTNGANNNVYTNTSFDTPVQISGTLEAGSIIGISFGRDHTDYHFAEPDGQSVTSLATGYKNYFFSDDSAYIVVVDGDNLKLAERPSHYHPICGDDECGDHGEDIAWTKWTSTTSLPTSSGNYYLSDNVTISSTWSPQNNTVLCLNGKTITMSNSGASDIQDVITIDDGVTFTLTDCPSTVGKITHTDVGYGRGVNVAAGTFNMYGGRISGNTNSLRAEGEGGGVYVGASGIFNLYGGSITGNAVKDAQNTFPVDQSFGGGIYVDGTLNMSGGSIDTNTTNNNGGGVCVDGGTFNMNGGSISENQAVTHGGGVYFRSGGGTFNMNGGSISENSATYDGGGVYTYPGCTFNMVGGSISDNRATRDGGGVYVYGTFNLRGTPTISGNTANGSSDNVSVSTNRNINVIGALTNTTPIGVTVRSSGTGKFAGPSGDVTTLAEGYADKFTSDNQTYDVLVDDVNLKLAQMVTVSFNANGGNGTMEAVQVENGSSYTLPTCGFITPEGKQFKGWATSATGEVISTSEITLEGATTLYAIWEDIPTTCTVTFNMNGHGEQIAAATVSRDEKVTKPTDPSATGYTFGGWYQEAACETAWDFDTDTVSGATTLYAKWTANTYAVTLNTNGATINNNDVTGYTYGVGATLPAAGDMTKASHRFDGWYESADFNGSPVTAISTTATGDKTYYAKWTEVHDIEVTVLDTNNSPLSGVKVKLMQGSTQFGEEKTTDTDGKITFTAVPLGSYNVVAEQTVSGGTKTKTELVILEHTDATLTITMPDENVSSTLTVTGNDTPDVVVGGLDDEAADQTYSNAADQNTHVSIGMSIESKEDVTSGGSGSSEEASQQTTIKQAASAQQLDKVEFLSITVTKTVTTNGTPDNRTELEQTQTVLELIIPYSLAGKYNIGIYRHHNGRAEAFAALGSQPGEQAKRDKTFWIDTGKELIHIYTNRFSNYAIAYSDAPVVTPTPDPAPSGGGSYAHACVSKCQICGGCTDAKCTERVCAVKCKLLTMSFADVTEALWCYDAVTYVYHHGLMQGYGDNEFYPDGTVTRQQVWMILARMSGADPKSMAAARLWAMETGISDGTDPTAYVTRQQFVTMLWRYAKDMGWDVSVGEDTNILSYNDAFSVAEYAIPAMQWACGEGIIAGKTSANGMILAPKSNATRGQLATMMMRFCTKIAN